MNQPDTVIELLTSRSRKIGFGPPHQIDGAGHLQQIRHIVVPMSGGVMGVLAIMQFIGNWNNLMLPLILMRDDVLLTPHVAFYSETALDDLRRISAANIAAFLDGRPDAVFRLVPVQACEP